MEKRTQKYKDKMRREQMEEAAKKAMQVTQTKEEKKRAYYKSLNPNRWSRTVLFPIWADTVSNPHPNAGGIFFL